jgi:hypothetical protein
MVTGEQVKKAMMAANVQSVEIRRCSICNSPLFYDRKGEYLFFDSNCDCTSFYSEPQLKDWESVAELINVQSNPEYKKELAQKFGIELASIE